MSRVFHSWYDRYVPDQRPIAGTSPLLLSLKFQTASAGQHYADLILCDDDDQLHALPFVRLLENGIIYPKRAQALGEPILSGVEQVLNQWRIDKLKAAVPAIDIFTDDKRIHDFAALAAEEDLLVPGLAAHGRLLSASDRYAIATARLKRGRSLDLNPRSAYGLSIAQRTLRIDGDWVQDSAGREVAKWFGLFTERQTASYKSVIALQIEPQAIDEFLERAHNVHGSPDRIIFSTRTEAGAKRLRDLGFEVEPLVRPAMRATIPDEWIGVRDQRATVWSGVETVARATVSERPLRVLFLVRTNAAEAGGWGDIRQVQSTADALRRRGHAVEVLAALRAPCFDFDIIHLTRLTGEKETLTQAQAVATFAGPVCLMPIFNDHAAETVWGMQAAVLALWEGYDDERMRAHLDLLRARQIQFVDGHGRTVSAPPARNEITPGALELERAILKNVDYLIGNAYGEIRAIYRHVDCSVPFSVVPTSTNAALYHPDARAAFVDKYGLQDFVLCTGRIESRKNQALLMYALGRHHDRPLVLIGGSVVDEYPTLLRALWRENVTILSNLPETELAGAYAAARVATLPSWDEVCSLSSINAAACLTSLVLTRNGFEHEYFRDDAEYCDPADVASIEAAVDRAWESHDARAERRVALRRRVEQEYSWDVTAEKTEQVYYRVLRHNPRGEMRRNRAV